MHMSPYWEASQQFPLFLDQPYNIHFLNGTAFEEVPTPKIKSGFLAGGGGGGRENWQIL
jgi:hypothetical protein